MERQWGSVTPRQMLENITLLWTLNELPQAPRENELPIQIQSVRQLTLEREKFISDTLAFLSATSNDPLKVMAVCIEESLDHHLLTIRLATNTGDCSEAEAGLKDIAKVLEVSSQRGKTSQRMRTIRC